MLKKIIIGLAVFFILAIGTIIAIPFLFKDEINAAIKEEINNSLNAKVDYGKYDLSLLRSFPNFSFQLSEFSIVGVGDFKGDTLAYIPDFRFTIDLMSVYKKEQYKILQIALDKPQINAIVNKEGKANWDIAKIDSTKPAEAQQASNFSLAIKKYAIKGAAISYEDFEGKTFAYINNLDFEGSGDVSSTIYDFDTKTAIEKLTVSSGAVTYLNSAKIKAENKISVDQNNSIYTFKDNQINVNDLGLLFDGFFKINKSDYSVDVKFKSKEASFKSILSLIPAVYKKDFNDIKTAGILVLDGSIKGLYSEKTYPAMNLNLAVTNGMFQYPSLPTAVTNIQINTKITKEQGSLDRIFIDVSKFHADLGTDPIDARLKVSTPISDPNLDLTVKGKMNLANVPKFYPLEGVKKITGLLVADLNFKGRKSAIDRKNYDAVNAAGTLSVSNLVYDSKETPMPLYVSDIKTTFNPRNITLTNLTAKIGKSDYQMSGEIENYLAYAFNKGDLVGKVNLKSNYFDVDEWLSKDETAPATNTQSTAGSYFQVPSNIDFDANATFGKINYDKLVLTNAKGNVKIKNETIYLNDIYANTLGGNATIGATYSTAKSTTPKVDFNYDIKNFDFNETYKFVGMAEKIAPVIKYVNGNFSSNLTGSGSLTQDMSVDYNTLKGDGKVQINTAKVVGLPILEKIASVVKIPALQNLAINNAYTLLQFKDGKVKVEPTDIKFGNGYKVNFQGFNGFDQSIDYDLRFDVPSSELGGASSYLTNMIPKVPGLAFKMPETVNLFLKVGGTVSKPIVKIQKVGAAGGSAKEMIQNTVNDLKDKAEDEARKQAEILKQKAQEEADKIKKQAEDKVKQEADKVKKDVENKAKDAVKGIKLPW
jgi:hypothetical protein